MIIALRLYKYLDLKKMPFRLMFVVNLLKTDHMFNFFKDCTGLDLCGGKQNIESFKNKI